MLLTHSLLPPCHWIYVSNNMWPWKAIVPQWWSASVLCCPRGHPLSPAHLYLAATEDTSVQILWLHYERLHTSTMCLVVTLTLYRNVFAVGCGMQSWSASVTAQQYRMPYHTNTSVCHSAKHWQISVMAATVITMKTSAVHTETFF